MLHFARRASLCAQKNKKMNCKTLLVLVLATLMSAAMVDVSIASASASALQPTGTVAASSSSGVHAHDHTDYTTLLPKAGWIAKGLERLRSLQNSNYGHDATPGSERAFVDNANACPSENVYTCIIGSHSERGNPNSEVSVVICCSIVSIFYFYKKNFYLLIYIFLIACTCMSYTYDIC